MTVCIPPAGRIRGRLWSAWLPFQPATRFALEGAVKDAQGVDAAELTTGKADWRVWLDNTFYLYKEGAVDTNLGALAEKIDFSRTPGNWKSESFDASGWKKAVELETAAEGYEKFLGILKTFRLEERPIPLCVEEEATLDKELGEPVLGEKEALTVEPGEKKVLLFDGKTLLTPTSAITYRVERERKSPLPTLKNLQKAGTK